MEAYNKKELENIAYNVSVYLDNVSITNSNLHGTWNGEYWTRDNGNIERYWNPTVKTPIINDQLRSIKDAKYAKTDQLHDDVINGIGLADGRSKTLLT